MDGLEVTEPSREKMLASQHTNPGLVQRSATDYPYTTPVPYQEPPERWRSRLPCGLSVIAYTLLVGSVCIIIVGAGMGGGIGAVARSKDTSMTTTITATVTASSATSTTTTAGLATDYAPLLPTQVSTLQYECDDGALRNSTTGQQFQLNCNKNFPGSDLLNFVAYTLDDCIEACSNYNNINQTTICRGIVFNANMDLITEEYNGNCYLKSSMANAIVDTSPPSVGAVLSSS